MRGEKGGDLWAHPPVRDVSGAHHGGNVDHRVPHHAGTVGLRVLTNQVAGQEATMGTTHKGHTACIKVFLLEHLLYCKLQGGQIMLQPAACPAEWSHTPSPSRSPSPCYLDVLHILVAHIAGEGEDAVLAKARGATIIHWRPGRDQTGWSSDLPSALSPICEVGLEASCTRLKGKGPRDLRLPSDHTPFPWQLQVTSCYHHAMEPETGQGSF